MEAAVGGLSGVRGVNSGYLNREAGALAVKSLMVAVMMVVVSGGAY